MKSKVILLYILIFEYLLAQTFTVSVSSNVVQQNERFQLSFIASGNKLSNVTNLKLPNLNNFQIISGPNQGNSYSNINGNVSESRIFSFVLAPKALGEFIIPSGSININGKNFNTQTVRIKVIKGAQKQQKKNDISNKIKDIIIIKAIADKNKVFKGEQVLVKFKLYTAINLNSIPNIKLPQYNGFWAERLDQNKSYTFQKEVMNGRVYYSTDFIKAALFPTQTGNLEVTPLEMTIPIQIKKQSNNFLDDFFGDNQETETINYQAKSNSININVIDIPNEVSNSSGAVGQFDVKFEKDRNIFHVNEPFKVKVTISGKGNIPLITSPELKLQSVFDVLRPRLNENYDKSEYIKGTKSIEYLVIPRSTGAFELGNYEFIYFDPVKKESIKKTFELGKITVGAGNNQLSDAYKYYNMDIAPIIEKSILVSNAEPFFMNVISLILIVVISIISIVYLFFYNFFCNINSSNKSHIATTLDEIDKLKLQITVLNTDEFYKFLNGIIIKYFASKFGLLNENLTYEIIVTKLYEIGIESNMIDLFQKIVTKISENRFTPNVLVNDNKSEILTIVKDIILKTENVDK